MEFSALVAMLCVLTTGVQTHMRQRRDAQNDARKKCGVESAMTPTEAAEILKQHNDYRKAEQASDMIRMEYSTELARRAQEYASGCHYEHGLATDCSGILTGQNLFVKAGLSGESDKPSFNATVTMNAWMKEKAYYDYGTEVCSSTCGHFKQIVNAATKYVGCGYAQCDILTEDDPATGETFPSKTNTLIVVCNYRRSLGYESIFTSGDACAECPGRTRCVDGMCEQCELTEENCVCPVTTPQCVGAVNIRPDYDCQEYQKLGDCDGGIWREWALDNCAKTCNCYLLDKEPVRCKTALAAAQAAPANGT